MTRFERATTWTQTRRAPKLRYIPLARMTGLEPAAGGFGDRCSTELSYIRMERPAGVEPAWTALQTAALPLGHSRLRAVDGARTRSVSLED